MEEANVESGSTTHKPPLEGCYFLSDIDSLLGDILSLCLCFKSMSWSHVRRDVNFVFHHVSGLVP